MSKGNPNHDPITGQFISAMGGIPVDYNHMHETPYGVRSTTPKKDNLYETESENALIEHRRELEILNQQKIAAQLNAEEAKRDVEKTAKYKIEHSYNFKDGNRYTVKSVGNNADGSLVYIITDERGNIRTVSEEEMNHKEFKH